MMNPDVSGAKLQEVAAPAGWTAMLLPQEFPIDSERALVVYRESSEALLSLIPAFGAGHPEELLLVFERLRPQVEIPLFQGNARSWLPEFGVGVWLDAPPPTTWSKEEFQEAAPGKLRPVVERVVRVRRDAAVQRAAWDLLAGTGSLLRVVASKAERFVTDATDEIRGTITDPSLGSFPFYVPLLKAGTLGSTWWHYSLPLEDYMPSVLAYARESVEDGGLLVVVRERPEKFWAALRQQRHDFQLNPVSLSAL